jgi:hypothetical protein
MSQTTRVLNAVKRGAKTSAEVAAFMAISQKQATARLIELAERDLIHVIGEIRRPGIQTGRLSFVFEHGSRREVLARIGAEQQQLAEALKTTSDPRGCRQGIDDWLMEEAIERKNT